MQSTDRDLDRYGKLLAVLTDEAAAPNERDVALKAMKRMEDENPSIRLHFAKRQAERRAHEATPGFRGAGAPKDLSAFWQAVSARFGPQVSQAADRVVGATVEQFTAAGVAAVEDIIRTLEDTVMAAIELIHEMREDDSLDLGQIQWSTEITTPTNVAKAMEMHAGYDDDATGVLDPENQEEGDIAQIAIQIPLGLLLRVAEEPLLAQAFVLDLLAQVDGGDDEDGDGEVVEEPPRRSRSGSGGGGGKRSRYS